ncbi:MAG: hypothetical protein C4324_09510 [Blastocatellia bacterium]
MITNSRIRIYREKSIEGNTNPGMSRFLAEKALHLRIVEEFLAQIEASMMKHPATHFDTSELKAALRSLRDAGSNEARAKVEAELDRWFIELSDRDAIIEAYHIRRYCDALKTKLPIEVFLAAARFYRSVRYSRRSQSKFDLVITRAFSSDVGELRRTLVADRDDLARQIAALYSDWDISNTADDILAFVPDEIVARFDDFVEECVATDDFTTLTSSHLFDRIREYKATLETKFFHPRVVAAAVGCNIAVRNRLNYLMTKASESLGERLGADYDLAGAFHDPSPNAAAYLNEVLSNVRPGVGPVASPLAKSDADLLQTMFHLAAEVRRLPKSANDGNADAFIESVHLTDLARLDPVKFPIGSAILSAIHFANHPTEGYYRDCLQAAVELESVLAEVKGDGLDRQVGEKILRGQKHVEDLASMAEEYLVTATGSERELLLLVWNRLLQLALRANRIVMRSGLESLGNVPAGRIPSVGEINLDSAPTPSFLSESS